MQKNTIALIVGIDHYDASSNLKGCVNDARSVADVLEHNDDGSLNFTTPKLLLTEPGKGISSSTIKDYCRHFFLQKDPELALFYFSGHGYSDKDTGRGYLCGSDVSQSIPGFSLNELLTIVNKSTIRNKIIVLDSCFSGSLGLDPNNEKLSDVSEGTILLTSSTKDSPSVETISEDGEQRGVFTYLFVDALKGGASDILGRVTPASIYAYIDQSLGPLEQRPVFKANVKEFITLRRTHPSINIEQLRMLPLLFPSPDYTFPLDPSFEPERDEKQNEIFPRPNKKNCEKFKVLQNYVKINLVTPVGAEHMWHAAMYRHGCRLTPLGRYYRMLTEKRLV